MAYKYKMVNGKEVELTADESKNQKLEIKLGQMVSMTD